MRLLVAQLIPKNATHLHPPRKLWYTQSPAAVGEKGEQQ